jgi:hypothetical protein
MSKIGRNTDFICFIYINSLYLLYNIKTKELCQTTKHQVESD